MQPSLQRWSISVVLAIILLSIVLLWVTNSLPDLQSLSMDHVSNFKTIWISLILEAFPFILLGVLVSACLQTFVSEQTIRKLTPRNPVIAILFACGLGVIFPICECGMIPVVRRLIRKGMPIYIAVVFILIGPILNPVVFASTYMAFRSRPEIAYSRMGLAFVIAFVIGLLLFRFLRENPLKLSMENLAPTSHSIEEHIPHLHAQDDPGSHQLMPDKAFLDSHNHTPTGITHKFLSVLRHASDEFFEMGKYLMIGALLAALIQTLVARESLIAIGQGPLWSHIFMMGFAYVLSICSTSDAFIASSFATTFSTGSLLTFLVFGPMLDIKSTLMLFSVFKARFVLQLSGLVVVVVLLVSLLFERIFLT